MSEIQFSMAKNSELIFTLANRLLCSAVNPTKEAQQWIQHHQALWKNRETVIVIGLGCGYHVRALKACAPSVLVLEPNPEIIKAALKVHPLDLQEAQILQFQDVHSIRLWPSLIEATKRSYGVLVHEPSAFLHSELFDSARQFLLGREREGLFWLFENRGFPLPPDFDVAPGADVHLKSLDVLWSRQLTGREDLMPLMQALRELIL